MWCPLTESNCQLKITNLALYHLTKGAEMFYIVIISIYFADCEISLWCACAVVIVSRVLYNKYNYQEQRAMKQSKLLKQVYQACLEHNDQKIHELRKLEFKKILRHKAEHKPFTTKWTLVKI